MKIFSDMHHLSLFNSLVRLFEDRLGMQMYRPIGLEWYREGYWAVYDHPSTVTQYLGLQQEFIPPDGTPPLNKLVDGDADLGVFLCSNPETGSFTKACTFDWFKQNTFDYIIASIPQHVERFRRLIKLYQPKAKLIVQIGNVWPTKFPDDNLLCSVHPNLVSYFGSSHAVSYHQEFDLNVFKLAPVQPNGEVNSYINNIEAYAGGTGWQDFSELEKRTKGLLSWSSYGGQCRNGSLVTSVELARTMIESSFVFHVKPGGDGYGHILHNAFAIGRPVVTRLSDYEGSWGGELMIPGTCLDLDKMSLDEAAAELIRINGTPEELAEMGRKASDRFSEIVNFADEELEIRKWMESLR